MYGKNFVMRKIFAYILILMKMLILVMLILMNLLNFLIKKIKEKTVHWSYINHSKQQVKKDFNIHYMMIEGERFEFPYGLQMREFFYLNDENLFPVNGSG